MLKDLLLLFRGFLVGIYLNILDLFYRFKGGRVLVWKILSRNKAPLSACQPEDCIRQYIYDEDASTILEPHNIPINYSASHATIYYCPGDIYNVEKYPFFYNAIHEDAKLVKTVKLTDFISIVDNEPWPDVKVIFLWSVGRCGSTLLGNLFTSFHGSYTISEPDDIFRPAGKQYLGEEEYNKILKLSLKFHLIQVQKRYPDTRYVVIKPRSMDFWYIVKTPPEIYHTVTHIFMYRDVVPVIKSFMSAFGDKLPELDSFIAKLLRLKKFAGAMVDTFEGTLLELPDIHDKVQAMSSIRTQSSNFFAYMAFAGLPYSHLLYRSLVSRDHFGENGLFAVKYENLTADPVGEFERIARRISGFTINEEEKQRLLELAGKDSQKNSSIGRDKTSKNKSKDVPHEIMEPLGQFLSASGQEDDMKPGFLLPNTI